MKHASIVILLAAACGGGSGAAPAATGYKWDSESTLSIFMKKKVNAPFSKLSFLLFQDGESDTAALTATAGDLAVAASELHAWSKPPGDSAQARQVFYEYAAAMKADATQIVSAAQAGDRDKAALRFEKLREKCDSCHHFFRYGQ